MAETTQLIQMLQEQLEAQKKQTEALAEAQQKQTEALIAVLTRETKVPSVPVATIPSFVPFDPTVELWTDYWARFLTFLGANSVPNEKRAQVFLTKQTRVTYKLLSNLASQQSPPTSVNDMDLDQIEAFMREQFDPTRYVVRERFKFWSEMRRKPGKTIQELAARIRHDAVTCDFPRIKDSLDEALRTRFMCSVGNEAILKALFKVNDDELTFTKAIAIAVEIEEAAKVAKETVYGSKPSFNSINQIQSPVQQNRGRKRFPDFPYGTCPRCGK